MALGQSPAHKKQQEKVAGAEDAALAGFAERFFKDILPHIGSKPHIVYLSTQAQTLLKEFKPFASSSVWVLPRRGTLGKPFANNALNQALKVSLQG